MAVLSAFHCPRCDYELELAGGYSRWETGWFQTLACRSCTPPRLFDAAEEGTPWDTPAPPADHYACPAAKPGEVHELAVWRTGDPCPACGGLVEERGVTLCVD